MGHSSSLSRHCQLTQAERFWLPNNATTDNSKMEVSWPVNHIDYLLLYNLVAKEHVQEHRLK